MSQMQATRRSTCPISSALEVVGDRWSLLIVRDMLFARAQTFKDFRASAEKIATNILADRLESLEARGIVTSRRDPEDGRRTLYELTAKGVELAPVVMELSSWGKRFEDGEPPPGILEKWTGDREGFMAELRRVHGSGT